VLTMGLTTAERRAFEAALVSSHTRRVEVDVYTLDGDLLSALGGVLIDGQVNVDFDAESSRSASLTFLDPNHAINFDTDSPDDGALYADRIIRIRYGVHVPSLGRYVEVPVFTGPVTGLRREGVTVHVDAQGKEALVRGAVWSPMTFKKGATVTGVIWTLLAQRGGETQFNMPTAWNGKGRQLTIPRTRSIDRKAEIWATAKSFARSINRQLYYDGAGVAVLRPLPSSPVYTFRPGNGGSMLTPVAVEYQLADIKNTIEVVGQPPSGSKGVVRAVAKAPAGHPLSPNRLGRNGAPRYLVESVDDSNIRSNSAAAARAREILNDRLLAAVDVTFDSLPIPHLDGGDIVSVQTPEFTSKFRLRKFTIPLAPSGEPVMSVGYLKRVTPTRRSTKRRGSKR
jgi:hypothetical protein